MSEALKFETETCSRCWGSGEYSYCESYGHKCFKCAGCGKQYTTRAKAAILWEKAQKTRQASQVKVGERIKITGIGTFRVVKSELTGSVSKSLQQNGEWKEYPMWELRGAPEWAGLICGLEYEVQVIGEKAEEIELRKRAIEYQNSLTRVRAWERRMGA